MQETKRNDRSFSAVVGEIFGPQQRPGADEAEAPGCLGKLVELPSLGELEDAPQTAVLAVLQHALAVAAVSLAAEHGCVGRMAECYEGRMPGRQEMLAQLVVDGCTQLSGLLDWYRLSCPHRCAELWSSASSEQMPF